MKAKYLAVAAMLWFLPVSYALAAPPEWYQKLSHEEDVIVGYGEAGTIDEAKAHAAADIAKQIQLNVSGEDSFEKEVVNDTVSQKGKTVVNQKTDVVLSDVETKAEQRGKTWYVACLYENVNIGKKCAKRLKLSGCTSERQNKYLEKTPLFQEINKEAGCKRDFRLIRDNKIWYLTHQNMERMLPLSANIFARLFVGFQARSIALTASNDDLVEGSAFSFTLRPNADGFVTLIDVYENGEVFIVAPNLPAKANKSIIFPDPSVADEMAAGLLTPGLQTKDLYLAVYSRDKADFFNRIQRMGKQVEKDEDHYKFAELLDILDGYDFSSVIIRTRPKGNR